MVSLVFAISAPLTELLGLLLAGSSRFRLGPFGRTAGIYIETTSNNKNRQGLFGKLLSSDFSYCLSESTVTVPIPLHCEARSETL
jgi:hypothetical protein